MTKKSVVKNYSYNLIYQILIMIVPLITTPYLSRVLGAENIGIYSYTISITTYFILFGSLGVSMYGQREIAYTQDNPKLQSKTFYEILVMRFITLGISSIGFYFAFCYKGDYSVYYKILLFELLANALDISWFFQGIEEFKKTIGRNLVLKILGVVLIFIFVKSSEDLYKYFVIYVSTNLIANLSLWLYLPKFITKIKINELKIFKHLKPTISLFIPQIAVQIYTVLDKTMIGAIVVDKSEVGYYEQAQKIVKLLMTLATSLGTVMMPRISYNFAQGKKEEIEKYISYSLNFIIMLALPLIFGVCSVANKFVPLFYGPGYDKVAILICVISPIILIIGLSNVFGTQYLLPTKQQKKFTISVITGAIVNFVLNLILIKKYASVGASIATVFAEIAVTLTQFSLIRNEIKIWKSLKMTYKYALASIIMFIGSMLIGHFISSNVLSVIVQVAVSSLIYFILLFVMKDGLLLEGIELIKKKVKRD